MIADIAICLPSGRLTNETLAKELGRWNPDEIFAKTGIRSRCVAGAEETAVDLAETALGALMLRNDRDRVDFLIFCTQTGDYKLPASACLLQARAGFSKQCGCLDINLACSGFIYGLMVAEGLLQAGTASQIVLVNADTYTHYIHPRDTVCRPIFGDAAAATLLKVSTTSEIKGFVFGTDGSEALRMFLPAGGERHRGFSETVAAATVPAAPEFIRMDGPAIYNFTLRTVPAAVKDCMDKAGYDMAEIDYFVFHQANAFMLESLRRKIGIPSEKFIVEMADTGNLVSASIPVVLAKLRAEGRIQSGTRTLLCGFGVGLSWAACIVTW